MNSKRSQPPALAMFLLCHLCPKENREVLIGDLVESFREGHSDGWFWRQALIALVAGVSKGLRLQWPQACFAVAGTLVIQRESWIMRMPAIERLWERGISLQWPLSTAYDFGFTAVLATLMLLPLLAILLLLGRTASWHSLLRTLSISFPLLVASNVVSLFLWGPQPTFRALLILIPFFMLLISALVGCSPWGRAVEARPGISVRLRKSIRSREAQ